MVKRGDVWRKAGPCDWIKVVRVQLPEHPNYDGGLPGCSVRFSTGRGGWQRRTWFYPAADAADFERLMVADNRSRVLRPNAKITGG